MEGLQDAKPTPIAEANSAGLFNVSKEALPCEVMRLIYRL
jgi:hypothetical protein